MPEGGIDEQIAYTPQAPNRTPYTCRGTPPDLTGDGPPEGDVYALCGWHYWDYTADALWAKEGEGFTAIGWVAASAGGGGGAPTTSNYVLNTPDGSLPNAQSLSALATGILKSTTGTGMVSIAVAGTDYSAASHTHAAADIASGTIATARLGSGVADATTFLRGDQAYAVPPSGGAPIGSQYLVLAADATLTAERVLTGTADQVILADGGAGLGLTLSLPQSIATTSTPQFARLGLNVAADANNKLKVNSPATADTLAEVLITASAATQKLLVLQGAVSQSAVSFTVQSSTGAVQMSISGAGTVRYGSGANSYSSETEWRIISTGHLNWNADTYLYRDAANTMAHRNSTTSQALRVYNTFTTLNTNGEWFSIDWKTTADVCNLWTVKGSSAGTARNLGLGTDGTQRWSIHATTGLLAAASGVELQLGNAAAAGAVTPTHTVTLRDSTGTLYRVPCLV